MKHQVLLGSILAMAMVGVVAPAQAQFGACCSGHGGTCGCRHGGVVCCDGFEGSSCACQEEENHVALPTATPKSENPSSTIAPTKQAESAPTKPTPQGNTESLAYLPKEDLTPGDVRSTNPDVICKANYIASLGKAPEELKSSAYKAYGIKPGPGYEIDHLISKGLGGSSTLPNLWPQSRNARWNMRHKDSLENHLRKLVCARKLDLEKAQQGIRRDWVSMYKKYLGTPTQNAKPVSKKAGKVVKAGKKSATPAKKK